MSVQIAGATGLREVGRDGLGALFAGSHETTGRPVLARIFERQLTPGELLTLSSPPFSSPPDEALAAILAAGNTDESRAYALIDAELPADWAARREHRQRLTQDEAVALLLAACDALSALHAFGGLYGTITPDSVIHPRADRWRLIDPGLATVAIPLPPAAGAAVGGVLAYSAPEVIEGGSCSPASDLFSLAATVIELITGPRAAASPGDLPLPDALRRALTAALDPVPGHRPEVSALRACAAGVGDHPSPDPPAGLASAESWQSQVLDDDVQFTVYRPHSIQPGRWSSLLAFAHRSQPFVDEDLGPIDPLEEMRRQASARLGADFGRYGTASQDSSQQLPRGSSLTFVPEVEGVEFNPPRREFLWMEPVHEEEFRMRAEPRLDGQRARGRLSVYFGSILIAEVSLSFGVSSAEDNPAVGREHARPYRKIFISYSHRDQAVVEQVETFLSVVGDEFLRDANDLHAGEVWEDRLAAMIREADVFQLFWSTNSMRSPFVRREWTYALGLNRAAFIRPTYWESPMPEIPDENLPPDELRRLHFRYLPATVGGAPPADSADAGSVAADPMPKPLAPSQAAEPPPGQLAPGGPSARRGPLRRLMAIGGGVVGGLAVALVLVSSLLGGSGTQSSGVGSGAQTADFDRALTVIYGGRGVTVGGPITCPSGDTVQLQATLSEAATGARARGSWFGRCAGHSRHWTTVATVSYGPRFTAGCGRGTGVAVVLDQGAVVKHLTWQNAVALNLAAGGGAGGHC